MLRSLVLVWASCAYVERAFSSNDFALPIELDFASDATNGHATLLRIAPLSRFSLNENWSLVKYRTKKRAVVSTSPHE